MSYSPHLTDGKPIRFPLPPAHIYCSCGIAFERPTEEQAVAAQAAHAAEMRNPDEHEGSPF